eukprot:30237-Pelagococcus_subviridis.AAC.10
MKFTTPLPLARCPPPSGPNDDPPYPSPMTTCSGAAADAPRGTLITPFRPSARLERSLRSVGSSDFVAAPIATASATASAACSAVSFSRFITVAAAIESCAGGGVELPEGRQVRDDAARAGRVRPRLEALDDVAVSLRGDELSEERVLADEVVRLRVRGVAARGEVRLLRLGRHGREREPPEEAAAFAFAFLVVRFLLLFRVRVRGIRLVGRGRRVLRGGDRGVLLLRRRILLLFLAVAALFRVEVVLERAHAHASSSSRVAAFARASRHRDESGPRGARARRGDARRRLDRARRARARDARARRREPTRDRRRRRHRHARGARVFSGVALAGSGQRSVAVLTAALRPLSADLVATHAHAEPFRLPAARALPSTRAHHPGARPRPRRRRSRSRSRSRSLAR